MVVLFLPGAASCTESHSADVPDYMSLPINLSCRKKKGGGGRLCSYRTVNYYFSPLHHCSLLHACLECACATSLCTLLSWGNPLLFQYHHFLLSLDKALSSDVLPTCFTDKHKLHLIFECSAEIGTVL